MLQMHNGSNGTAIEVTLTKSCCRYCAASFVHEQDKAGATINDVMVSLTVGTLRRHLAATKALPDEPLQVSSITCSYLNFVHNVNQYQ
jgi:hypothetical protein